ncbi:hypothetical protein [Acidovorax sp.]|jgi:hypothetical protein|nr:hypothetical protein [Acidovorax sp.]
MSAQQGDIGPERALAIGAIGQRMSILLGVEKFLANSARSDTHAVCH